MFILDSIDAHEFGSYTLVVDKKSDLSVQQEPLKVMDVITNGKFDLMFTDKDEKDSSMTFQISDKDNKNKEFKYLSRYWPSYCDFSQSHNSGAYDFRPIDNLFEALPYSELIEASIAKGKHFQKMTFYFEKYIRKTSENGMRVIVHVQLDRDTDTVRFDVDLVGLPKVFVDGREFVPSFEA